MGQEQDTCSATSSQKRGRFPPRTCLRQDCNCVFLPGHWNQRYCREPDCARRLRRWQAAKRQRHHRSDPENGRKHAKAERQRRRRRREENRDRIAGSSPRSHTSNPDPVEPVSRAWSRSETIPENFCDRPGCYKPVRPSRRAPAHYCSDPCRQAMRRVLDRERKYKQRKRKAAAKWPGDEKCSTKRDRRQAACSVAADCGTGTAPHRRSSVRGYRNSPEATVSSRETRQEVPEHDRETSTAAISTIRAHAIFLLTVRRRQGAARGLEAETRESSHGRHRNPTHYRYDRA